MNFEKIAAAAEDAVTAWELAGREPPTVEERDRRFDLLDKMIHKLQTAVRGHDNLQRAQRIRREHIHD